MEEMSKNQHETEKEIEEKIDGLIKKMDGLTKNQKTAGILRSFGLLQNQQ